MTLSFLGNAVCLRIIAGYLSLHFAYKRSDSQLPSTSNGPSIWSDAPAEASTYRGRPDHGDGELQAASVAVLEVPHPLLAPVEELELVERDLRLARRLASAHSAQAREEEQVLLDAQLVQQRIGLRAVAQQVADVPHVLAHVVAAAHAHGAPMGPRQTAHDLQDERLAAAIGAQEHGDVLGVHLHAHLIQDRHRPQQRDDVLRGSGVAPKLRTDTLQFSID